MLGNQVRIIGGKWRSRKLNFPNVEGLRPTPDRIRETLFNWLSPYIVGASCLDAFAGSGALGFEALSRGASSMVMCDRSSEAIAALKKNADTLNISKDVLQFYCGNFLSGVSFPKNKFDIVFLDPPFHQDMLEACFLLLQQRNCLAENALIYVEAESDLSLPLPDGYEVFRHKMAGQVGYWLITAKTRSIILE